MFGARRKRHWLGLAFTLTLVAVSMGDRSQAHAQAHSQPDPAGRRSRAEELTAHGQRLVERGDPGSAVWFLREALAIDPAYAVAAVVLADIYLSRHEPSAARDIALATSARAPSHGPLWLRLALSLFALNDPTDGLEALREGLRHAPDDVGLLRALIDASLRRGDWLRALSATRALTRAERVAPVEERVAVEQALRVLAGSSDRVAGLRCADPALSSVRRALSQCSMSR